MRLLRELDALLPLIFFTGEADHMRGHIAGGIKAAVLALLKHAGNFQCDDFLCFRR